MVAGDEESYVVFKDLFDPVISGEYKTGVSLIQYGNYSWERMLRRKRAIK